jgi:ribonuclease HI
VATWQALNLCAGRGLHHVVLQGDSKNVVTALIQTQPNWNSHRQIVEDTKVLLQSLHPVVIQHASRAVNTAAHTLAKVAISQLLDELWAEECPSYIQSIVLAEQISSF